MDKTFSTASTEKVILKTGGDAAGGITFAQMEDKLKNLEDKPRRNRGGGFNDAQSVAMTVYMGHGDDDDMKSLRSKKSRKSGRSRKKSKNRE